MIKIFADYVMAKSKRVDITLKYDHENVLLVLPKKRKLSSGPCNFLYGEKWIGQVNICKPSPKAVLISASQSTVSVLLATNRATKFIL